VRTRVVPGALVRDEPAQRPRPRHNRAVVDSFEVDVESVFGVAFAIALCAAVLVGLAIGSGAEGADAGPALGNPVRVRLGRAALLATAAYLAVLGAEAALVAGAADSPGNGRTEATVFILEGLTDLLLVAAVLLPAWTLRRIWVLRLIAVCWLGVGLPALLLTFGAGPLGAFYLGLGPTPWAAVAVFIGAGLVWSSSLLGPGEPALSGPVPASNPRPEVLEPRRPRPPTRWRGIVTGVALASLVAVSLWPAAQFAGVLAGGGCAPGWLLPSDPEFCVSVAQGGELATVSGRTTLPDGALVDLQEGGMISDTGMDRPSSQRVAVANGQFEATFDLSRRSAGSFMATAEVRMSGQPPAVIARYGSTGQGLSGPAVWPDGSNGGRRLFARLTFAYTG
jgi:hypothetical protein